MEGFWKNKIKGELHFKATKPEPTNISKVLVRADRYPVLAPVDVQTQVEDLIDSKFVHLYCIPTRPSEKRTLTIMIKGLEGRISKECTIQLE